MSRSKTWLHNINRTDLIGKCPSGVSKMFVCSDHFEKHMFTDPEDVEHSSQLPNSYPTMMLHRPLSLIPGTSGSSHPPLSLVPGTSGSSHRPLSLIPGTKYEKFKNSSSIANMYALFTFEILADSLYQFGCQGLLKLSSHCWMLLNIFGS
jgi:hypothetical protein